MFLDLFSPFFVKKLTVRGIIGNTHGVSSATNPAKNAPSIKNHTEESIFLPVFVKSVVILGSNSLQSNGVPITRVFVGFKTGMNAIESGLKPDSTFVQS